MGEIMKNKLGVLLKKIVFSFGILYGINLMLIKVGINIPINLVTLGITTFLGIPGLLSIFTIFFIIN